MKKHMKLTLKHFHHQPSKSLITLLKQQLGALRRTRQIDEARVLFERREASPPFRVSVYLVTPGPDVHAESVDHTLRAAIQKVFAGLEAKIRHRWIKQARPVPGEPRTAPPSRFGLARSRA